MDETATLRAILEAEKDAVRSLDSATALRDGMEERISRASDALLLRYGDAAAQEIARRHQSSSSGSAKVLTELAEKTEARMDALQKGFARDRGQYADKLFRIVTGEDDGQE